MKNIYFQMENGTFTFSLVLKHCFLLLLLSFFNQNLATRVLVCVYICVFVAVCVSIWDV